jgi:hypothetical protein
LRQCSLIASIQALQRIGHIASLFGRSTPCRETGSVDRPSTRLVNGLCSAIAGKHPMDASG